MGTKWEEILQRDVGYRLRSCLEISVTFFYEVDFVLVFFYYLLCMIVLCLCCLGGVIKNHNRLGHVARYAANSWR